MKLPKFKREKKTDEKVKGSNKPKTGLALEKEREYNFFRREKSSKKCMEKLYCNYFDNMCNTKFSSAK